MTDEFPWAAESSDKNASPTNDKLESLGFSFFEKSSTHQPESAGGPGHFTIAEPVRLPERTAPDLADIATAALVPFGSDHSTALVPMSRRALRDAERTQSTSRRSRRSESPPVADAPTPVAATDHSVPVAMQQGPAAPPVNPVPTRTDSAGSAPRRQGAPMVPLRRRIAKKVFPPTVMLVAAALLVGTSVPATALFNPDAPPASTTMASIPEAKDAAELEQAEGQVVEVEVEVDAELVATIATRDEWSVTSYAELLRLRYGSVNYAYSTSGTGAIRWPFPYSTQISSGFGDRVAPCRGCSSYHRGLDFIAPYGAPVGSIAEGVVTAVGRYSSYGYRVEIEHVINGQRVTSLYAHLVDNSSVLQVGSIVQPGEIVGALGNTGLSTGPHLHLEVHIDGIPIDPFSWLQANAS